MKKYKLISTGLVISMLSVFGVMACGPAKKSNSDPYFQNYEYVKYDKNKLLEIGRPDLSSLASYIRANQGKYPNLTKEKLAAITTADLAKLAGMHVDKKETNVDEDKEKTFQELEKMIVKFMYENNSKPEVMKEINKWIVETSATQVFSSHGRGPWVTDERKGIPRYFWKDTINFQNGEDGTDYFSSRFKKENIGEIKDHIEMSHVKKGYSRFMTGFAEANFYSGETGPATVWSPFRAYYTGETKYKSNNDGSIEFTELPQESFQLDKKLDIYVGKSTNIASNSSKVVADTGSNGIISLKTSSLKNKVKEPRNNMVRFVSKGGVKYAKVKKVKRGEEAVEEVVDSGKEFKAKHMFYGFLRNLYSSKELRVKGKVEGKDIGLPKFTKEERIEWLQQFDVAQKTKEDMRKLSDDELTKKDTFNNSNTYLFDLFNINLKETIEKNKVAGENEFFIVYKENTPISIEGIEPFVESSTFTPYPKENTINWAAPTAKQITEFDKRLRYSGKGNPNTLDENYLSIAPYLYTKYSWNSGEAIVLKKNKFYSDSDFANDSKTINVVTRNILTEGKQSIAHIMDRKRAFKNALKTKEFLLDAEVYSKKEQLLDLSRWEFRIKPNRKGHINSYLYWNFNGYNAKGLNDLGIKMLWGVSKDKIAKSTQALDNFFTGSGAQLRAVLHTAINWYTIAQTFHPNKNRMFYGGVALSDSFKRSGIKDPKFYQASYLESIETMKEIYDSNTSNNKKAHLLPTTVKAAATLDKLATQIGATKNNPAQIPVFRYVFANNPNPSNILSSYGHILGVLNSLSPKVKFVFRDKYKSYSDYRDAAYINGVSLISLRSFGPDYDGVGSILDQYLRHYGSNGLLVMTREALAGLN